MVFPSGEGTGCGGHCVYMYILPPHQIRDIRTFNVTLVIINIPVTPMAQLCKCGSVESLQLVLVGRIFLFGGFLCVYMCFDLLVYLCVFYSYSAYSVSVSQGFLRYASLCGVFPLSVSYGYCPIAPCFKPRLCWGGGGVV